MLQLKQNGLLDELRKKWVDDQNLCAAQNSVTNTALKITDFSGLWYLVVGMLGLGLIWALGEIILIKTLAANPFLREAFIRATQHVANAGKRLDLLSMVSSNRSGKATELDVTENPALAENPVYEPGKDETRLESPLGRSLAFARFDATRVDIRDAEERGNEGGEVENESVENLEGNKDALVVVTLK